MIKLKQSEARKLPVMLIDSSDHVAPKTGIAEGDVTVKISKNGGALTNFTLTDKWTELGQGLYTIDFAIGDLDTEGFFAYLVTSAGCDQYSGMMYVEDFSNYKADVSLLALEATAQSIKGSTDNLPVDPADESLLEAAILAAHAITDAAIATAQAILDTLPPDPADESSLEMFIIAAQANVEAAITAGHNITDAKVDTVQGDLDYVYQKERGRWKIENDKLIYYKADGVTPLRTFNLFDSQGDPTSENPYERVPT